MALMRQLDVSWVYVFIQALPPKKGAKNSTPATTKRSSRTATISDNNCWWYFETSIVMCWRSAGRF